MRQYTKLLRSSQVQFFFAQRSSAAKAPKETNGKPTVNAINEKNAKEASLKDAPKIGNGPLQAKVNGNGNGDKCVELPSLPVPPLGQTLDKFAAMSRPFLACDEFCRSECLMNSFGAPGGPGEKLQECLEERAKNMDNWLEEWWLNTAYLAVRTPVVIYSSPAQVFPRQVFNCEEDFIMCGAKIIVGALEYKTMVDEGKMKQEMAGNKPLEMEQYTKVFGTSRIPDAPLDRLKYTPNSEHIIVMHNNHMFKLNVKKNGKPMEIQDVFHNLQEIIRLSSCAAPPIGALTAECRDNWAKIYCELNQDDSNKESINTIEESLFILCLDRVCPPPHLNNMTTTAMQVLHGGGPAGNIGNRWFDKTLQFVVGRDGGVGITYEHSPAEGGVIANIMDFIVPLFDKKVPYKDPSCPIKPEELEFNLSNDKIKTAITNAQCRTTDLVNSVELCCFSFNEFGKEEIKQFKQSPDSFIQMALQYAFYRLHQTPGAVYETGSLRAFKKGRTETIRSLSKESMNFVKAMMNDQLSVKTKVNSMKYAIESHKRTAQEAMAMKGIDRHLLGLRKTAEEMNMPPLELFNDGSFQRSSHFRLSTSQVPSKEDGFMAYGPLVEDGYGCCYNPRPSNINFGISAFTASQETDPVKFKENLEIALNEMHSLLCESSNQSKL